MSAYCVDRASEVAKAMDGVREIKATPRTGSWSVVPYQTTHNTGGAVMGSDPTTSVVTPFFSVLDGPRIPAPGGAGFAAGDTVLQSYFDDMFLGRGDVATTLSRAQAAANAAARQ